jgi:hypothetical protein
MNYGKTTSGRNSGLKSTKTERDRHTLRRAVPKNHRFTAAQVKAELNIHCENPGSISKTRGSFCDGLGSNIMGEYSVGPIITLHGLITAREYVDSLGNQVHSKIQTLFLNNDAIFEDKNAPIHTTELFSHGLKSMKVNFSVFPG